MPSLPRLRTITYIKEMMNITILKDNNSNEQNEKAGNLNLILSSHQNDLYFNRLKWSTSVHKILKCIY